MNFITAATVQKDDEGKRADKIFRIVLGKMPLSRIYKEIRSGFLRINGRKTKEDAKVSAGDTVDVAQILMEFVHQAEPKKPIHTINREAFKRRIVFEDDGILVINKKKGELVHSDGSSKRFTPLDQLVREYLADETPDSISFSPGPLHRLDRNTSGIIAFGKSTEGAREFSSALRHRETRKCYIALLDGRLTERACWEDYLTRDEKTNTSSVSKNGKGDLAITIATPFLISDGKTLAQIEIKTGRTHQIRCQASFHRHPLTGDAKYHGSHNEAGYYLHSSCITAGERIITGVPGGDFTAAVASLMGCSETEVKTAVDQIISSFAGKKVI
ncbi:MAG: RluA family pseudouridine synthase [Spirochaetia bacterium]|nr:RluA family pseudouridine synthase [Spirochaetia bacterium]